MGEETLDVIIQFSLLREELDTSLTDLDVASSILEGIKEELASEMEDGFLQVSLLAVVKGVRP